MNVEVHWQSGLRFQGQGPSGHPAAMDAGTDVGGANSAPRPTELLLIALGGCTGMDVVSILEKMRTPPRSLSIQVQAERNPDHPRAVRKIHLTFTSEGVPETNLAKAVQLSLERYCSVAHSLSAQITTSVVARP